MSQNDDDAPTRESHIDNSSRIRIPWTRIELFPKRSRRMSKRRIVAIRDVADWQEDVARDKGGGGRM